MTSSRLLLLVVLFVGLGIGFLIGRFSSQEQKVKNHLDSNLLKRNVQADALEAINPTEINGDEALKPRTNIRPITTAELSAELIAFEQAGFDRMSSMRKLTDLQDRLRMSDIASIAKELFSQPSLPGHTSGFYLIISTFAEKDPEGAWKLALGIKSPQDRKNALWAVISPTIAKNPALVLNMIDQIQDAPVKQQARSMAITAIAQKDPWKALDLAMKNMGSEGNEISMIFNNWARRDLEGAKAALAGLSGRVAQEARRALISSLVRENPQAAWNYALTLPLTGNSYQDPRAQVIADWAQSDPQAALKMAFSMSESEVRTFAISSAVNNWSRTDFNGALQYVVGINDSTMRSDILRTMNNYASGNRQELLKAVLEHMPPGDSFQQTLAYLFSSWAMEDPTKAAAAINQLPPGQAFSMAAAQIASQWTRSGRDKQEVFNWVRQLPEGEGRLNALQSVFREWSGNDPKEALKALNSLAVEDRKQAMQALASGWSQKDPKAALQWASSLSNANERNTIVQSAISQWANFSPKSAASYIEHLPEANRSAAMQAIVNSWASKDTQAAAEWLRSQPAGASKDPAVASLANRIFQEDPETALAWVNTISDPMQRAMQVEQFSRNWLRQDPASARAWISKSQLPAETRQRLLK